MLPCVKLGTCIERSPSSSRSPLSPKKPIASQFDWPQWQGPDRTAHSKEAGLLKQWPKEGPPLAWNVKALGGGDSTPAVADGQIYGMSHRGSDEVVWALSEKDGKEVWARQIWSGVHDELASIQRGSKRYSHRGW